MLKAMVPHCRFAGFFCAVRHASKPIQSDDLFRPSGRLSPEAKLVGGMSNHA